jgi:hypothetical protein
VKSINATEPMGSTVCVPTGITTSATNDVTVTAGGSGSTTASISWSAYDDGAGCAYVVDEGCVNVPPCVTVTLPAGVTCPTQYQTLFGVGTLESSFTITFTTSPSTPPGPYHITLVGSFPVCISTDCDGFLSPSLTSGGGTPSFHLNVNASIIPEYPLGLPLLAILMLVGYTVLRRKTITNQARP